MASPAPQFAPHSAETRENCFALFKKGKKLTDISELTGIPLPTLRRWSSRDKWKYRMVASIPAPGRRTEQTDASVLDNSTPEVDAIAEDMTLGEKQEDYKTRMGVQAMRLPHIMEKMTDPEIIQNADKISKLDATARKALNLEEQKPSIVVNVGLLGQALPARPAVLVGSSVAGALPGPSPEIMDAEFTSITPPKIQAPTPEPVEEEVAAQ